MPASGSQDDRRRGPSVGMSTAGGQDVGMSAAGDTGMSAAGQTGMSTAGEMGMSAAGQTGMSAVGGARVAAAREVRDFRDCPFGLCDGSGMIYDDASNTAY